MAELAQVLVFLMWSETWFLSICLAIFAPEATSPGRWAMREQLRACRCARAYRPIGAIERVGDLEKHVYWLVVWNILYFSIILGIIIPTDELIFFRGVGQPPIKSQNRRRSIMATSIEWPIIAEKRTPLIQGFRLMRLMRFTRLARMARLLRMVVLAGESWLGGSNMIGW